jgi:hypothetical protein
MRVLEVGHFARKQIGLIESAREPEPVLSILRQRETTCLGSAVLVCSLARSLGLSTSLVETEDGRMKNGAKGVLPLCSVDDRNLVLDLFDESSEGLNIRTGSKTR